MILSVLLWGLLKEVCACSDSMLIVLHLRRGKVVMVIKVDVFQKKKKWMFFLTDDIE